MRMIELKLNETIGHDEYTSVEDVDVFVEDEVIFTIGNKYIVTAQMSSSETDTVDYSVYNIDNLPAYDGGQIDCSEANAITIGDLITYAISKQQLDSLNDQTIRLYQKEVDRSLLN